MNVKIFYQIVHMCLDYGNQLICLDHIDLLFCDLEDFDGWWACQWFHSFRAIHHCSECHRLHRKFTIKMAWVFDRVQLMTSHIHTWFMIHLWLYSMNILSNNSSCIFHCILGRHLDPHIAAIKQCTCLVSCLTKNLLYWAHAPYYLNPLLHFLSSLIIRCWECVSSGGHSLINTIALDGFQRCQCCCTYRHI